MYLKRIEIAGFKSFADRTDLEFPQGVTAVVGPNGSGKSNIADAVRWVLGEQSAKSLRGTKMEDVIFAGSDSRKAVNYSEVSLTLDNRCGTLPLEFSEVTVTRRLYRSGESEYFINKTQCRLKDITELFMDTGLGKEAYSIIGQGKIEEVLSTKSEERRGIFEEAAGIVKYKARKREAEKKLEETETNLIRVADIISEIEDQLEPLEEQANKAKKYKDLKEQLKQLEVGLYVYNIETIHQRWQESKQRIQELDEQQLNLSTEVNRRDALIEEKRWAIIQLDQELEEQQRTLLDNVEQLQKLEGELKVLEERERNANEKRATSAEKMSRLQQKRDTLLQQLQEEQAQYEQYEQQLNVYKLQLKEEQERLDELTERLEGDIEQLKSAYIDLLGEIASTRNEHKNIEQIKASTEHKKQRLLSDINAQKDRCATLLHNIGDVQKEISDVAAMIDTALQQYRDKSAELQEVKNEQRKIEKQRRQKEQVRDQMASRLEVLKEMQSDYAGFAQGVKEVLKAKDTKLQGIKGAVAELINVPQKYEVAIEIALGSALQNIVVDNEQAAREAIAFLKAHHLGRATFLPMSVMKGRRPSPAEEKRLMAEQGVYGLASDLVQFEQQYAGVMENLLGTVIVAEDLEVANRVAHLLGHRYRIVTLDGDVVNPGGSMTGGSIKQKNNNLLGRNRAIEELEHKIKEVNEEIHQCKDQEKGFLQQEKEIGAALETLRENGEALREKEQELKNALTRVQTEYKNEEQRLTFLLQELEMLNEQIGQYDGQWSTVASRLQTLEQEEADMKLAIDLADQTKREQEISKERMTSKITELKVSIAQLSQQLSSCQEGIRRLEAELKDNEEERKQLDLELQELFSLMAEKEKMEIAYKAELEKHQHAKIESSKQIEEKKALRAQLNLEMEQLESGTKQFRNDLRSIEDLLHKEEVKANRAEVELDNLLQKLREEYEMTYEAAKADFPPPNDEDVTLVRQDVFRLKRDITSLGNVNLGAIDEYERLKERYDFLTMQCEDLKAAKLSLRQVIQEMDAEMKKRFIDSFEQIQQQFRIVFSQLFGGGRADLILTDPTNLLETGIEIVAQPPGKKLQNLALLSGGERALTAIALLFAILRVRPVPFCVLDEVEAALDEANVYRFAQYLKEFSAQTQFIVITHRKGTMEGADVLYGVTMEGSGVSKLVSVKLDEFDSNNGNIA